MSRVRTDKELEDLGTVKLSDLIKLAENGDRLAALEVVDILAWVVSTHNTYHAPTPDSPDHYEPVPIPAFARNYLSDALQRIANGEDANKAFNVKKSGRPQKWSYYVKRLAVDVMAQLLEQNAEKQLSVEAAAACAAEAINKLARELASRTFTALDGTLQPIPSPWQSFVSKPIDESTLKTWYYELKKRIAKK